MRQVLLFLLTASLAMPAFGQCSKSSSSCSSDDCAPSRHTVSNNNNNGKYQRFTLIGGAGAQYTIDQAGAAFPSGKGGEGALEPATNAQRLNFQAFGFAGYRFNGGYRAPHAFGVFGTYGQLTPQALTETNALQGLVSELPQTGTTPDYREIEAGFLIRNWFRISAGIGEQRFVNDNDEMISQQYYSATAGFHAPLGRNLVAYANATTKFGRDFAEFSIRPSAGLAFQLRAFRF